MDKYYKGMKESTESRTRRHKGIYSDVSDDNYDNLNLTTNVSVIKTNADLDDIDSIKEIISEKYEKPKRSHKEMDDYEDITVEDEEVTKEYDLKKVIETAHKNKVPNYDRERFEHLRETQYDILSSLNIERKEAPIKEETLSEEEVTIINLIKTVNENAEKNHHALESEDDGDLLSDLMGDGQTEVLKPIPIEEEEPDKKPTILEELEKTKQLSKKDIVEEVEKLSSPITKEELEKTEEESEELVLSKTEELSQSFYTGKYQIGDKDMDDFLDLEKEMKGGSVVVKILIGIIVVITLCVAVYLLNKYLNLGLF